LNSERRATLSCLPQHNSWRRGCVTTPCTVRADGRTRGSCVPGDGQLDSVRFYARCGFEVTDQGEVLGTPNWWMRRPARKPVTLSKISPGTLLANHVPYSGWSGAISTTPGPSSGSSESAGICRFPFGSWIARIATILRKPGSGTTSRRELRHPDGANFCTR